MYVTHSGLRSGISASIRFMENTVGVSHPVGELVIVRGDMKKRPK